MHPLVPIYTKRCRVGPCAIRLGNGQRIPYRLVDWSHPVEWLEDGSTMMQITWHPDTSAIQRLSKVQDILFRILCRA